MGTRSVTVVRSRRRETEPFEVHAAIFRHWDGYPGAHGMFLAELLEHIELINGYLVGHDYARRPINKPGRLAAWIVHRFLEAGHDPSILGADPFVKAGQDFTYLLEVENAGSGGDLCVKVFEGHMMDDLQGPIFEGTHSSFKTWCGTNPYGIDKDEDR